MGITLCRFTWSGFGIHLITAVSIIKRLSLCEFTLEDRHLVSVVRIRESACYRIFFFKKIYENFVVIFSIRNIEVSILERCPYQEVTLNWGLGLKQFCWRTKARLCLPYLQYDQVDMTLLEPVCSFSSLVGWSQPPTSCTPYPILLPPVPFCPFISWPSL